MGWIFDNTMKGLQQSMGFRMMRHRMIASNLAHADTPGFRPLEMTFRGALVRAFAGEKPLDPSAVPTHPKHFPVGSTFGPEMGIHVETEGPVGLDRNLVDLDRETGKMLENSGSYNASAKLLQKKLAIVRAAIEQSK